MRVVCIICTDQIEDNFCAAPCGHTFHFQCLSEWLLHRKSCPQCRETCKSKDVIKLFVTSSEVTQSIDLQSMDPKVMREKISLQEKMMTEKDDALEEARSLLGSIQNEMLAWQLQHKETYKRLKAEQSSTCTLKKQLASVQYELDEVKELRSEAERLRTRVSTLQVVERMLVGTKEEINMLISSHNSSPAKLATVIVALKKDYDVLRGKRVSLVKEKDKLSHQINHTKKELEKKERELRISRDQVLTLESDLLAAEEEKRNNQKKVEMLQRAIDSPDSYHTLKRILESPMPNLSTRNLLNVGASPLLISEHSGHHLGIEEVDLVEEPKVSGVKRLFGNKDSNIVMPVPKKSKKLLLKPKTFSSQVLKKDFKFDPRKTFLFSKK